MAVDSERFRVSSTRSGWTPRSSKSIAAIFAPAVSDLLQELEETARAVGEPDVEGQEPERGKTRLQVAHLLEPADDACIPVRRAGDLEEDDVPVDPVVGPGSG